MLRSLQTDQNQPTKGNRDECISQDGQSMPCRSYNDVDNLEEYFPGQSNFFNPRLPNTAKIDVFVGIKSSGQSIGHQLVSVVSVAMNQSLDRVNFFLPPHYEDKDLSQNLAKENWRPLDVVEDDDDCAMGGLGGNSTSGNNVAGNQKSNNNDCTGLRRRGLQDEQTNGDREYNMYYTQTDTTVVARRQERWWWRYTLIYNCFWADTDSPINSNRLRQIMSRNMSRWVQTNRETLQEYLQDQMDDKFLVLTVNEEDTVDGEPPEFRPGDDTASEGDPDVSTFSILQPVDARAWDWQRYLGLALFVTACSSALLLAQLGAMRQRRRIRKQVWSNLASEEGVKELLNTGWILCDNRMEVYDKSKYGYKDDESMLIGGFEQKEAVVGTEITFNPTTGSEKTPRSLNSSDMKSVPSQGNR
jgi:hypothetical protein